MPIPPDVLNRVLIPRVLSPAATVAELLFLFAEQPEPSRCYAVVRLGSDAYDVLALDDLQRVAEEQGSALLPLTLGAIPGLLVAGAPVYQSQIGEARAEREKVARHRRRLVVLDDSGDVIGVMVSTMLSAPRGASPLDLINPRPPAVLGLEDIEAPPASPHLNTRFDGVAPGAPLVVGRRIPLIVSVGAPTASNSAQSSRPFTFDFDGATASVSFTVRVDADPDMWSVRVDQPTLTVAPPGTTTQEAEFTITAKQPGRDKLMLTVERDRAVIQSVWLPVTAAVEAVAVTAPVAKQLVAVTHPLDVSGLEPAAVVLTIQSEKEGSTVVVRADLPDRQVRDTFRLPVSSEAVHNATKRLRDELKKVVVHPALQDGRRIFPFANNDTFTVDPQVARAACVDLAQAGYLVWDTLFRAPRGELRQIAEGMRGLPHGSRVQIVLDRQEFIVPWALLYDRSGEITTETLDWSGFWGYRYVLDVLPPGGYPAPTIDVSPLAILMLFNEEQELRGYTSAQEAFIQTALSGAQTASAWGYNQVRDALCEPSEAGLVYCYCHGERESGAVAAGRTANESALLFGPNQRLRVIDLRDLPIAALAHRPLVFVNACEGATQEAFYYDGFMPYFIEEQLARGFIGTEVKAPQLLAHDVAIEFLRRFAAGRPVGEILLELRRAYLDQHNNILAFNYSLYCTAETRLAKPLIVIGAPPAGG